VGLGRGKTWACLVIGAVLCLVFAASWFGSAGPSSGAPRGSPPAVLHAVQMAFAQAT